MADEVDRATIAVEPNIAAIGATSTTTMITKTPQQSIDDFWETFTSKKRGKALTVLPDNHLARTAAEKQPKGEIAGKAATADYETAAAKCRAKVAKIVKECRRTNQKYRDAHFDLENYKFCLMGLTDKGCSFSPRSVLRVGVRSNPYTLAATQYE